MIARIVLSGHFHADPPTVRHRWGVRDLIEAHVLLDHMDAERARNPAAGGGGMGAEGGHGGQ